MEFYKLPNSSPIASESPRMPREWIRIGIIVALVLAVVVIGFLVLRKRSGGENIVSEVKQELASCETEDCAIVLATNRAKEKGDASLCRLVEGDGVTNCIKQYAYDKGDPSACDLLKGDEQIACASNAQYLLASRRGDISLCESIKDARLQTICGDELIARYASENRCAEAGSFKDICQKRIDDGLRIARQIGPGLCEPFLASDPELGPDGEEYVMCLNALDTVDLDGDGLVIHQEIELGTDNQKADTDGDGYDDGTEVRGGYNPLGT